jgi:hypothetical protein
MRREAAAVDEMSRGALATAAGFGALLVACIGAALGVLVTPGGGATAEQRSPQAGRSPAGLPPAGTIRGTIPFSTKGTVLFAARAGSLFVLVVPPGRSSSIAVVRVASGGKTTRKRVPFARSAFLMDVSAGPDGVYGGTAVIKRFTTQPDQLVRIDPRTLAIRARASFPASVAAVEQGQGMWAALGDGRVVRLDPRTLAIEASRRILPAAVTTSGAATLSKPAVGLGSVWVLAGDAADLELVRLDPTRLAIRSRTRVPTGGRLRQALHLVVADASHVYLVGSAIVAVDRNGELVGRPLLVPDLATAAIHGAGLVGLTGGKPAVVLLNPNGRILAKTRLADAGATLAVSGRDAWLLGDAGRGNGIVHIRLATR